MTDAPKEERAIFLSNLTAGRNACRFAFAIIAASTIIFLAIVPFAKAPLAPLPAFIPLYQSALVINDLVTAVFLLGQYQVSRSDALAALAGGYLFSALMSTAHALTFPGLFSPTGLLYAGPQTTAWLYMFWHGGFPLFVIAYASYATEPPMPVHRAAIWVRAAAVVGVACCFALLATVGQGFLPTIMEGNHYMPTLIVVVWSVWLVNLCAVLALASRRPYSVLDLWLMVVMCAWLFDIALSAIFNAGRYDLGFYAGRIYGLMAASLVLMVLLAENSKLYVQLVRLHWSERETAAELRRLNTVDPLTGIANRRCFDDALDQEWRRMMRHGTALSLLMIDVDYFKRFNDAYGHVAGDACLRTVAQTLAGRARRAGEIAARYGGEEFAVLLPHSDEDAARKLAERMCESIRELNIPHAGSEAAPCVTVSIGIASMAHVLRTVAALSRDAASAAVTRTGATLLVETADHALYKAKVAGRNRVATAGDDDVVNAAALGGASA